MAIVITNIPNEVFRFYSDNNINIIEEAVLKGILLPDNATNGDVIKALFPDTELHLESDYAFLIFEIGVNLEDRDGRWWNTPYKAGDTD